MGPVVLALLALVWAVPAWAIDHNSLIATWRWAPATGKFDGYRVCVSRDGGPFEPELFVAEPAVTLQGVEGETWVLRVCAYRGKPPTDGVPWDPTCAGPASPDSLPVTFAPVGQPGQPTLVEP